MLDAKRCHRKAMCSLTAFPLDARLATEEAALKRARRWCLGGADACGADHAEVLLPTEVHGPDQPGGLSVLAPRPPSAHVPKRTTEYHGAVARGL